MRWRHSRGSGSWRLWALRPRRRRPPESGKQCRGGPRDEGWCGQPHSGNTARWTTGWRRRTADLGIRSKRKDWPNARPKPNPAGLNFHPAGFPGVRPAHTPDRGVAGKGPVLVPRPAAAKSRLSRDTSRTTDDRPHLALHPAKRLPQVWLEDRDIRWCSADRPRRRARERRDGRHAESREYARHAIFIAVEPC